MDPRLEKILGGHGLTPLRLRLRRHFERAAPGESPEVLGLSSLTAAERECLAVLMRRPPRDTRSMQLDVRVVDANLREAGVAESLRDALEKLDGPLVHHAAIRMQAREHWSALVAGCSHPALARWLQDTGAQGLLKRLAGQQLPRAAQLLDAATYVLRRLPADGMPLAQLAADTLGDAHGLDHGQPVATLVLAVWRQRMRRTGDPGNVNGLNPSGNEDGPADAGDNDGMGNITAATGDASAQVERARNVWARAGVLVNELARPVLLLNLPVRADSPAAGQPGEPTYLSLRQLLRAAPRWDVDGRDIFVCENPNLVAIAADQLGPACAPMVCTDGMPAAAQRTLLGQLAEVGAQLHYHGDFDWPGIQIANHVLRTWSARHWRLAREDYEAALAAAPNSRYDLAGAAVTASWDAALSYSMQEHGRAIAEEAVAETLLVDLRKR